MANSRTKILIPMLALCVFAVTAYGQAVLTLGSNPTRVRVEGITEVVGLITLSNNTNAIQVIPGGTTVAIVYDGTITNNPSIATNFPAGAAAPNANIYTTGNSAGNISSSAIGNGGVIAATKNMTISQSGASITLTVPTTYAADGAGSCLPATAGVNNLCLVPGGSLNIQGVRVAITGLPPGNVNATLTTVPANAITFPGGLNSTVVGRAQATIGGVTVTTAPTLGQCAVPATPVLNADGTVKSGGGVIVAGNTFNVNISEPNTFPTSFTAANSNSVGVVVVTPPVGTGGTAPQTWDEAGITPGGTGTGLVGNPTSFQGAVAPISRGVQFVLSFASMPAGLVLVAQQLASTGGPANAAGNGSLTTTTLQQVLTGGFGGPLVTNYTLLTSSGGAATITYEVTIVPGTGPTTVDTMSLPFVTTAPAGTVIPVGSLGTVQVSVGPVSTTTGYSTTATQIRFGANANLPATPISIGTVAPCLTNLLFPFVSNRTGTTFNTGLAIANTANDATFGAKGATTGQAGGVTLWFFGVSAPTGGTAGIALPIPAVSTGGTVATAGVIAPGEHTAFVLNDGSTKAIAPGFQGYVIALCAFQYAHGLATIFDNFGIGPANVGFSYLPLVLNGTTTAGLRAVTGNNGASANLSGPEVLAH